MKLQERTTLKTCQNETDEEEEEEEEEEAISEMKNQTDKRDKPIDLIDSESKKTRSHRRKNNIPDNHGRLLFRNISNVKIFHLTKFLSSIFRILNKHHSSQG